MPHGFDNTWGIVKDLGFCTVSLCFYFFIYLSSVALTSSFFFFSASVYPIIIDEQEAFIHRVIDIPFEQRKCRDLITLDTLHAYCSGLEPTPAAHRLNTYSHRRK